MKPGRIVVDSNIWISFLISGMPMFFKEITLDENYKILISADFNNEMKATTKREKFRKYFSLEKASLFINQLAKSSETIYITSNLNLCRDPKDDYLLNLSIDGKAGYLITGDRDLLILKKIENTKIVTLKEFEEIIKI